MSDVCDSAIAAAQTAPRGVGSSIAAVTTLALLLPAVVGCQQIAAVLAVASGGDTVDAEYKLPEGLLAVVVDEPEPLGVTPEAIATFHKTFEETLSANKIKTRIVALAEVQRLQQTETNYEELSIRQLGEKLGAEQVLYVRVKYWALKENPEDVQYAGRWRVGVKIVSTERKSDVRLWPRDGAEDRTIEVKTDPSLDDSLAAPVRVAEQLARKLGKKTAQYFYDHKPLDE